MFAGTVDLKDSEPRAQLQSAQAETEELLFDTQAESCEPQDMDELRSLDSKSELGVKEIRTLRRLTLKRHGHDLESWTKQRFPQVAEDLPWRGPAESRAARFLRAMSSKGCLKSLLAALVIDVRLEKEFA